MGKPAFRDVRVAALDSDRKVSEVLQLALVVALSRNDQEFAQWIRQELNGEQPNPAPSHRKVVGQLYSGTPQAAGPVTFIGDTMGLQEVLSTRYIPTPIREIEEFVDSPKLTMAFFQFPQDLINDLPIDKDLFGNKPQMFLAVQKPPFSSILGKVRDKVLEWACTNDDEDDPSSSPATGQDIAVSGVSGPTFLTQITQSGSGNQIQMQNSCTSPGVLERILGKILAIAFRDPDSEK